MLQLSNFCIHSNELKRFNFSPTKIRDFLSNANINGFEIFFDEDTKDNLKFLPPATIKGVHLCSWFCWLDFWQQNRSALIDNFGSVADAYTYFGYHSPEILVNKLQHNIQGAININAEYAVFHVCNVAFTEVFNYKFKNSDEEVITAAIELINLATRQLSGNITLLLENLWWPGLTFLNPKQLNLLLDGLNYPHIGFMFDTGHFMNTNHLLTTELEGTNYILKHLKNLGSLKDYIRGIHLHTSLSGKYVTNIINNNQLSTSLGSVYKHCYKIDQHQAFSEPTVKKIIELVEPQYLIHEFYYDTINEWTSLINKQRTTIS